MLSKKIYLFFEFISNLCQKFYSTTLIFNSKKEQFYVSDNPKLVQKTAIHYANTIFWAIASFTLLFEYNKLHDRHQLYLNLLYWLAGVMVICICTVPRWFPNDLCRSANGLIAFLKHFQSKLIVYITIFTENNFELYYSFFRNLYTCL